MANKLRVTFTTKGLMEATGASRRQVQRAREAFDVAIRDELKAIADEDFAKKSLGARSAGIKWKPLAASTVRRKRSTVIGVDTGEMKKSQSVRVNNRGVTISYGTDHAVFFDEKRPILPDDLPASWRKRLEKAGQQAMDRVLDR